MNLAYHKSVLTAFMDNVYKTAITPNLLENDGKEFFHDKLWFLDVPEGPKECDIHPEQHRTVVLAKLSHGNYIIPKEFIAQMPFRVTESHRVYLKKSTKEVWKFVTGVKPLMLPKNTDYDFTEFVDKWNPVEHTNPTAWLMLKLIMFATRYDGLKMCVCSEPATGKNVHFGLANAITRDTWITGTPSKAAMETALYYNRVINLNEAAKPATPEQSDALRDIILWMGDLSEDYNKTSLALKKDMQSMRINQKSLVITYNRKFYLKPNALFFDDIWSNPGALRKRYPQILLDGRVTTVFPKLSAEADMLAIEHSETIKDYVSKFMGIETVVLKQKRDWDRGYLQFTDARHFQNLSPLLDVMSAYCKTEEKWIELCCFLNNSVMQYKDMYLKEEQVGGIDREEPKVVEPPVQVIKVGQRKLEDIEKELL